MTQAKHPLHNSKRKQRQIQAENARALEQASRDKIAAALDEARGR